MDEIKQQVARARRRLILQQFFTIVTWSLFGALLVGLIGVAIPKIWPLSIQENVWFWSWLGGSAGVGLVIAIICTFIARRNALEAAIEIDRRFGLKERVSSALALGPEEMESELGQALVRDASSRVAQIDVREQFRFSTNWRAVLPLLPAAAVFLIALLPAAQPTPDKAKATEIATKEQIKKAQEELRKKLEERIQKAEEKGLKDAEVLLKELQQQMDKMKAQEQTDKKKAMIKLNDLKQQIEEQRSKLGGADNMRKRMDALKDIQKGPADRLADSMRDGDFGKAMQELENLQKKLANGEMTDEDRKALANQLEQMKQKLDEMREAHEKAKQDLQKQIEQAKAQGDQEKADRLQAQLNQLQSQAQTMQQMQQMADKLGQCAQCLKQGDMQQAANQMSQMANQLQQLQEQLDQLETLDDVLDQISDAKNAMNCKECGGAGCPACQGQMGQWGMGQNQFSMRPGNGLGQGRGYGARPEEQTDTGEYKSRVAGKIQKGEAVLAGEAGGANISGRSKEGVKEQVQSNLRADSDPLTNQRLPRTEARHAKEYFEKFRKGNE